MRARAPAVCVLLGVGIFALWVGPTGHSEHERVTAHLTRALEAMADEVPSGLSARQMAARAETMAWLEAYRDAGHFPHNHVTSGRTPVFVDPHGTPCAVGYLLLRSGERELVEEIVRTDNLVRVRDLEGDPRLAAWLEIRGITLAEAAMIQPAYGPPPEITTYRAETVTLAALNAAVLAYAEYTEPSVDGVDWPAWISVGTMAGHTALLAALLRQNRASWVAPPVFEYTLNGIGAAMSLLVAARRFSRRSELRRESAVTLAPWIDPRSGGVGVQIAVRR